MDELKKQYLEDLINKFGGRTELPFREEDVYRNIAINCVNDALGNSNTPISFGQLINGTKLIHNYFIDEVRQYCLLWKELYLTGTKSQIESLANLLQVNQDKLQTEIENRIKEYTSLP